jgi:hypothetical protein
MRTKVEAARDPDTSRRDARLDSLLRPSIGSVWAAIAVGGPLAATWLGRTQAIDLAYQVRAGGLMLDTHRLLTTDPFTFTAGGSAWLNQQWGAEVFFATVWRIAGWGGIAVVWGLLVGAASLFVYLACRRGGAAPSIAALLTLAAYVVAAPILTMRPQLLGIVLFAASLWIVTTRRSSPSRLLLIPALVIIWTNVHGSFVLVFAILGIAWLEDRRSEAARANRIVAVAGVSLVATLVNPFGVRAWTYVTAIAGNTTISGKVAEWGPPSVRTPLGALFFGSVLVTFVFLGTRSDRVPFSTYLGLCFYALLGVAAVRGIVWWALACPVLIAPVTRGIAPRGTTRSVMNLVFLAGLVALLVVAYPGSRGSDPATGGPAALTFAPEDLVAAAREARPEGGRMFVSEVYGSWVEFSAPDLPVFVDPRIELFPQDVWDDYFAVEDGREGWDETLDRWDVDVLILHPAWASGLLEVIGRNDDWRLVKGSPDGAVYVRV